MNKPTFIYALCEPETKTIRYVGKTFRPPELRLQEHCVASVNQGSPLGNWLSLLTARSKIPTLLVLKEVLGNDGDEWEKRYIRNARALGFDLVNGNDGGGGTKKHTSAACEKMSAAHQGNKNHFFGKQHTPEAKEKNRLAHLGKKRTPEEIEKWYAGNLGIKRPNNTSGFVGVYWDVSRQKWQSVLGCRGHSKHIGRFLKIEDAVFARALTIAIAVK